MIAAEILKEIRTRLKFFVGCGTGLSFTEPHLGIPFGRREPAHPSGNSNRLPAGERALYSG